MDKISIVKRLVRSSNYQKIDSVYLQCIELGIHVNRNALERFSQKLALIDQAERYKNNHYQPSESTFEKSSSVHVISRGATHIQSEHNAIQAPVNQVPNPPPPPSYTETLASASAPAQNRMEDKTMTYSEAKRRETEITFELGVLKIKESSLLEELNSLSQIMNEKH